MHMVLIKVDFVKLKEFTFHGLLLIWAFWIALGKSLVIWSHSHIFL